MSQKPTRIWKNSFKAAAIHLGFSLILVSALAILVFTIWYPAPLAKATGVYSVFAITFMVDFFIGPLLTLLVYKKNKKGLLLDLTIIVIIQVAAFFYGIYSLSQARPVWLSFYNNRFEIVRINDIEPEYLAKASPEYKHLSLTGPKWVAAKPIGSLKEVNDLKLWNRMGAKIAYQPAFYYPIEQAHPDIKAKAYDLSMLESANNKIEVNRRLTAYPNAVGWLPLWGQERHMVVLTDKSGAPLDAVDLRPWTKQQINAVVPLKP